MFRPHPTPTCRPLISLRAYHLLEDAWADGVADWCRAASGFVLGGGHAWLVTTSDGQANWIKRRLLGEGISLFGVRFLDARTLRRELCLREGIEPPTFGRHALELLLRLYALTHEAAQPELACAARHPGTCLAALDDFAAAGWLRGGPKVFDEIFPAALRNWLPLLRATGSWVPDVDLRLGRASDHAHRPISGPLAVCVFGWDAASWPEFDVLVAAARSAAHAQIYAPLPRGTSGAVQQHWLDALEHTLGTTFDPCESSGFVSAQSALAGRLEGTDLNVGPNSPPPAAPELLVGHDTGAMVALACDFVARWLTARPDAGDGLAAGADQRMVILCPAREVSSVALVKALAAAGIALEDEVGERPEPSLSIQIQRAVIAYHRDGADLQTFLGLIELLNEHAARGEGEAASGLSRLCPLDPAEARRALRGAFADVQQHNVRVLVATPSLARTALAQPLRELVDHLGVWPETLPWRAALARWEQCLQGLGLTTEVLEPLWSRMAGLPIEEEVPSSAFLQFLSGILAGVPPRRAAERTNRFAKVVVTSLEGAMGQTWGGALFLDSNEGAWPLYPRENSFLDDVARTRLNLRAAMAGEAGRPAGVGYLLTAADRAQLEHFRFLEILENCTGPLAFAGVAHDPVEPGQERYANEWALRCLVESGHSAAHEKNLLDRWRHAIRRVRRSATTLEKKEGEHLWAVFTRRRDSAEAFDAYFFNFSALTAPDELPWSDAWSGRDLETAWNRPATFALQHLFGAVPGRGDGAELDRREGWVVGRLAHQWLRTALGGAREPRRMTSGDWQIALAEGLPRARAGTEVALRRTLGVGASPSGNAAELPLWWRSALRRTEWAARRCLQTLAEAAQGPGPHGVPAAPRWLCLDRHFQLGLPTAHGLLKVKARCDALLLNRPDFEGASGQFVDVRTGAASTANATNSAQVDTGRGLGLGTVLLLGLAEGLDPTTTRAGVVHPEFTDLAQWTRERAVLLEPAVERLADQQRFLVFGQKGAISGGHRRDDCEDLPLATTPVSPSILAAKAARSFAQGPLAHGNEWS